MRQLVNPRHKELSVRSQTELLEIPRSTLYYKPIGESPENLEIMQKMDKHHIEHPTCGVLGMQDMLRLNGFQINHKRIRRLMRLMGVSILASTALIQASRSQVRKSPGGGPPALVTTMS